MKEPTADFKETFMKAKEPRSSLIVLEEVHIDALDQIVKSLIVCDSSYLN